MKRAAVATLFVGAALLGVAPAPAARADEAAVEQAVEDSWQLTCARLGRGLTGSPANDLDVFLAAVHDLRDFYSMSEHDASDAVGEIIGQHCDQYKPNVDATTRYAEKNDQ
jgi:hypothetical protein